MLKTLEQSDQASCLNKAFEDEMLFVLLARDKCAPEAIRYWAYLRDGGKPLKFVMPSTVMTPKIKSALHCADVMEATRARVMEIKKLMYVPGLP